MRFLIAIVILFASQAHARAQYSDTVRMTKGRDLRCEVLKSSCQEISVSIGGCTSTYVKRQVTAIDWDPSSIPASMSKGRKQFAAGEFVEAAANFSSAAGAKETRVVLMQECRFMAADCLRRGRQFASGSEAYRKLLASWPDSYFFREAVAGLVGCLTLDEPPRWEEAHRELAKQSGAAKEYNLPEEILSEFKLADARIYERESQPLKALAIYSGLTTHKTPPIAWDAQAGIGACELAQGQIGKAEVTFRKVVEGTTASEVDALRRSWNGLGECLLKKGTVTSNSVKEAMLCFLRTVTLYGPDAGDSSEDHRIALLFAARCFNTLAGLEPEGPARTHHLNEFKKLKDRFRENYGKSTPGWEKLVQEPL